MDVKFITTTRDLINTIPITDGQVIASKDANDFFYDMYQVRNRVGCPMWEGFEELAVDGLYIKDGTISVIVFIPNGGTCGADRMIGKVGDAISDVRMPSAEREGYDFIGWFKEPDLSGERVETLPPRMVQGETRYYAGWVKKPDPVD